MVSITDKQAERLFELLLEAAKVNDPGNQKRVAALKKEFVEILTWGSAIDAGKK